MKLDMYVIKDGKRLRCGYTTGSCAAAASKAAVFMLETGKIPKYVEIDTPAGVKLKLEISDPRIEKGKASCSVIKDSGDDPDVTDGIKIYAQVEKREDAEIFIDGGTGIGRITRKGLFGKVGEAAINPVPKRMIKEEIRKISPKGYNVLIYAPQGEDIGKRTYNENIGIKGGISIIGTKGIVYPMSQEALIKTIYMEVDAVEDKYGKEKIVLVPGNYGEKLAKSLGLKGGIVKVSNFIGDSILYIYSKGFKSMTLVGHIGKFAKLSIGIFNTHSSVSDARMEAFIYYLSLKGAPKSLLESVNNCLTAEEGLNLCIEAGYGSIVEDMEKGAEERIKRYLKDEDYPIKVIIYSMERGFNMG
ncbi:cobalt-precorrin-5B (C(1))-methyltransferase CbiD [Tepidimicrobium xylanilyticum]|uniref:Cobalt-precorrin-5B C(1)-methyltransferase n=1 Tax=Tepidimicrobium xylanilyticum TaxID=1123352 RepID=A0A1H2TJS5_9FIRM|nr:cobalt-precorrin-5B (C(1))-methyltransferase CbiD [Tepidimicrobium xylanilyticum]SDW43479.1 cobalt-precorrin 5B C1-methyltransferase [Tepidimicrobium xylanilyticum]